jgi:hypothetical protein
MAVFLATPFRTALFKIKLLHNMRNKYFLKNAIALNSTGKMYNAEAEKITETKIKKQQPSLKILILQHP